MHFIQDSTFLRLLVAFLLLIIYLGVSSAVLERPSSCNKRELLFKPRHVYTYDYTAYVSSALLGASPSKSGSKLSCTVTIGVPRRCEQVLKLSACSLWERNQGADDTYTALQDVDQFLQDLQRYPTYFQTNKGVVLADSILTEDGDTLQVLNIKRGIISALQFPVLKEEEYKNPTNMTDIFGRCLVQYKVLDRVSDEKPIASERNLRHCDLPNVYTKQINVMPSPSVGQMAGGVNEKPITEVIYPFEMSLNCKHTLNKDQTLGDIDCLQKQFFKPLAYQGDYLVTAMTNISQKMELKQVENKKTAKPDLSLAGRSIIDIRFDFGVDFNRESTLAEIRDSLTALALQYDNHGDSEAYEAVPGMFGDLLQLFRSAKQDVLHDLMMEVFDCGEDCGDKTKVTAQVFYLDGLESCGTDACIQSFLHCILHGHTTSVQAAAFLQGLKDIPHVSEGVLEKLYEYCQSKDETICWLTLGTILSKKGPEDYMEGTVLYKVLKLVHDTVDINCNSGTLIDTERKLITLVKTGKNVGNHILRAVKMGIEGDEQLLGTCLQNRVISTSVKIGLLQNVEDGLAEMKFNNIPPSMDDTFFPLLKDATADSTVKAFTFSLLMKTTNKETIRKLVNFMREEDHTDQMKTYMSSAVRTLLQNDAPDLKEVRASWEAARDEQYFSVTNHDLPSYSPSMSKSIGTGYFFKIPISEIFGGQIDADFIYDPSSRIFSTLKTAINYYYGEEKHKLFEFMVRVKGFDLLLDILLKRINMTPMELFGLYQNLKARAQGQGQDDEKLIKFQQNIVKAVEDILNEVNHPAELDFDISVDISIKGKDVMFGSLKELIAMMRQMRSKLPPNTSLMQVYLKKLMTGISKTVFKSKEIVGLVRDLPTCAGLPMNLTVHAYGSHKIEDSLQSNLLMYMAGKSPTLSASIKPGITLLYELNGELAVQMGTSHSSGMKAKILFGAHRDMSLKLTYGYSDPMVLVENPTKKKLELEMKGIRIDDERYFQKIFFARGRMQLNHFSSVEQIQEDPTVQSEKIICNTDQWTYMIFRKKMCLDFFYPNVWTSKSHAYFPLSGPFDLDVTIEDLDINKVDFYKILFEYERQKEPGAGYTDHIYLAHIGTDDTMTETTYAYWNMVYVRDDYSLTVDSAFPDFHYTYNVTFANTGHQGFHSFIMSEMMKRFGLAESGYIFKVLFNSEGDLREHEFHWNVTSPEIGWDIHFLTASLEGSSPEYFGDRSTDVSVTYYCSKERPLLYMFHLMPKWAAENFDTSKIHIKNSFKPTEGNENLETSIGFIEFYGRKVAWEVFIEHDGPTLRAHDIFTYTIGGVEKTTTADFTRTYGKSEAGMTFDLSGDIQGENYNAIVTGSCTASQTDVTASGDIQYHNTEEDNTVSRKKQSSVYEKVKAAEEAVVNEAVQIKKKIFGAPKADVVKATDRKKSEGAGMMKQLQDIDFPQLSIWDLKEWTAKVSLSAKLKPIFADGDVPGEVPPEGIEAVGTLTAEHPWNGGYVHHDKHFTVGKNMRNSIRNFKLWLNDVTDTSFTDLDGTPITDGNEPIIITRSGEVHAYRKSGENFDFFFNYDGPNLKKEYSILFDWDASTHHEPLYHVRSEQISELMPFLNHHFEEKLFYMARRHIKHNMEFSHEMLKLNMDTEFPAYPNDVRMHENGSVSIKVQEKLWSFEFENIVDKEKLECSVSPGSMPGKTFVYTFLPVESRTFLISGAMIMEPGADPTALWSSQIALKGTSMLEMTQSWTPAYHEEMKNFLEQGIVKMAASGVQKEAYWTAGDMIKQAVMPNFITGMKFWGRFIGNMVPLQHRPESPDVPGPVIAPRFAYLMQAMQSPQNSEPNPMKLLLDQVGSKAVSKLMLMVNNSEFRVKRVEEILKEGQYSYMISTAPYTFRRFFGFPKTTEFYQHVYQPVKEMFGFARYYYRYKKLPNNPLNSVAVIFGRHDSSRVLNVQTFDGRFFELTENKTEECTYLLASDLRQRRWSLVLSPAGVTLLTSSKTVTVGWDKNVYLDNCKLPSADISDGTVTVEKMDDTIHVHTPFGLSLECDTVHDNCLVILEGQYRNETIGLLGTNDMEKLTDFRLKNGLLATDSNKFMAEYEISGSQTCRGAQTGEPAEEQEPDKNKCEVVRNTCKDLFTRHYYSPLYKCISSDGVFGYHEYCENEARRCQEGVNSCHALKAFIDVCQKKGLVENLVEKQDVCQLKPPIIKSSMAGSLDLVFVISQHISMTEKWGLAEDYMFEIADLDAWDQFREVRFGVVLFGGSDAIPHVVRLGTSDNSNSLFTNRDEYDWDGLYGVMQQTAVGTAETDPFSAIQKAATFPFNPVAHKMIILLETEEQSSGKAADISALMTVMKEGEITLNIISSYSETSGAEIIGINSKGQVISTEPGYQEDISLPKNDFSELIVATNGALWDLNVISDDMKMKRMSDEFTWQAQQIDQQSCPAA